MLRKRTAAPVLLRLTAGPAAAFPGGQVFAGKVRCIAFDDGGSARPEEEGTYRAFTIPNVSTVGLVAIHEERCSGTLKRVPVS